jgi:hypothetical protein
VIGILAWQLNIQDSDHSADDDVLGSSELSVSADEDNRPLLYGDVLGRNESADDTSINEDEFLKVRLRQAPRQRSRTFGRFEWGGRRAYQQGG